MSTRANIIIKDAYTTLYFYRHSDGYPSVCGEDLKGFCEGYSKNLRADAMQSAGWLILRGHEDIAEEDRSLGYEWKVGSYEPTADIHADIEYLYVIDLEAMVLEIRETTDSFYKEKKPSIKNTKVIETHLIKRGAE